MEELEGCDWTLPMRIEEALAEVGLSAQVRAAFARFRFRADLALQRVGTLSGGQMLRAALACVLGGEALPPLLMLDEPTNHLDLESIAAIEQGLAAYDGALILVSHDEAFLEAAGISRRIELG